MRASARRWKAAMAAVVALAAAGCGQDLPQNTLAPAGPIAQRIDRLFTPVFWIAAGIFFFVEGLLVVAALRFRDRGRGDIPRQIHGNTRLEIIWTAIPALLLAGIAVPTVGTIFALAREPRGAMRIEVVGHQWWWEYRYPRELGGFTTANELHIPVGRPIFLRLRSADVIHSFWVPRLAGKQDVIPGRTTILNLQATRPGVYRGQCAEFCGFSHANMRLKVIAQDPADFEAWAAAQRRPAAVPTFGLAAEGARLFREGRWRGRFAGRVQQLSCTTCHTLDPTQGGTTGPNLAHLASRTSIAGASLELTEENLRRWLRNPPGEKPGSVMPNLGLSDHEIDALVAFLMTLK